MRAILHQRLMAVVLVVLLPGIMMSGCGQKPVEAELVHRPAVSTAEVNPQAMNTDKVARQVQATLSKQLANDSGPTAAQAMVQLDVGIVSFSLPAEEPNAAGEQFQRQIHFPLVRKAEARFLPYLLRQTLEQQAERLGSRSPWGVVRVLPVTHLLAELQVEGQILHSDGDRLQLRIRASDSSQRLWLDKVYQHQVRAADYALDDSTQVGRARDPYQPLFDHIADDLLAVQSQLSAAQLTAIHQLARVRYGESLTPDAFVGFYQQTQAGQLQVLRLPARDDPMMQRIDKLRQYEYFFIDHADQQYADLYRQMQPTYWRWRQYSRELALYIRDYRSREEGQSSGYRRGSLASMNEVYGDYEWFRMQQSNLRELAMGFNNEVLPTVLKLDDGMVQLSGDLDAQYGQWQAILQEIFRLEQGVN